MKICTLYLLNMVTKFHFQLTTQLLTLITKLLIINNTRLLTISFLPFITKQLSRH